MNQKIGLFALLFLSFISIESFAQIDKAWEAFAKNDYLAAEKAFQQAMSNPQTKPDACLGMSLVEAASGSKEKTFDYFYNFVKSSPNPYPFCQALWLGFGGSTKLSKPQVEYLEALIKDPRADVSLKTWAYDLIGDHYQLADNLKKAKEYYKLIGGITEWSSVGGFENISAGGFDKNFPPVAHPEATQTFMDKQNADVKWFKVPYIRYDYWVDLSYHYYTSSALFYTQSFIESPAATAAQLRLGVNGSLKVWINDQLIFSRDRENMTKADAFVLPIQLNKGANRILLQIGDSRGRGVSFICRLTDKEGKVLEYPSSADLKPYQKATEPVKMVTELPTPSEEYIKGKMKQNPKDLANYMALIQSYLQNNKLYEARKLLKEALKIAPDCAYILYQQISVFSRDGNDAGVGETVERIKTLVPDQPMALNMIFDEHMRSEAYDKAEVCLKKLEQYKGSDPEDVLFKRMRLFSVKKEVDKLLELIESAYKTYPDNSEIVDVKYSIEYEVKNNKNEALKILNRYLKNNYNAATYEKIAYHHFKAGNASQGFDIFKDLIERYPYAIGYYSKLAANYSNAEMYNDAIEYYKKCTELAPSVGDYYEKLGNTYELVKKPVLAKKAYETCLKYSPTEFDVRNKLRLLNDKKDIYDYFKTEDIATIIKNAPNRDKYPNDHALVLFDDIKQVVYPGGVTESKYEIAAKMFDATAVDSWKEYSIGSSSSESVVIEKAEVVKPNNRKITAETNGDNIVFTNLEPGDAIYISYKKKSYYRGTLASHFWTKQYFSYSIPYLTTRYSLLVSPEVKFEYKMLNSDLKPTITPVEDFKLYTWEMKNKAAITSEQIAPSLDDIAEVLHISSLPNWDYVSNWYADLTRTKAKDDFEVQETTNDLLRGKEKATTSEKIKDIYEFIVKNIRYSSISFRQSGLIPQKASEVLNTRIGDCKDMSTLFVSMCKVAGIDANLVLVSTRDNGRQNMVLPNIDFNHCIASVNIDGKKQYLELTNDNLSMGVLPDNDKDAFALNIDEKTKSNQPFYLESNPKKLSKLLRKATVQILDDDISVKNSTIRTGSAAMAFRSWYRDLGVEEQRKNMEKSVAGDYANARLGEFNVLSNLKDLTDSVIYNYDYKVADVFTEVGNMRIFKLPWSDAITSIEMLGASKRDLPIDLTKFNLDDFEEEEMTVQLPLKYTADVPENVTLSNDFAQYKMTYRMEGSKVIVNRSISLKQTILPANRFEDFKNFFLKVIKTDTRQMAIKKGI